MSRPKVLTDPLLIEQLREDRRTMSYRVLGKKYGISKGTAWNYCNTMPVDIPHVSANDTSETENTITANNVDTLQRVKIETYPYSTQFSNAPQEQEAPKRHTKNFAAALD